MSETQIPTTENPDATARASRRERERLASIAREQQELGEDAVGATTDIAEFVIGDEPTENEPTENTTERNKPHDYPELVNRIVKLSRGKRVYIIAQVKGKGALSDGDKKFFEDNQPSFASYGDDHEIGDLIDEIGVHPEEIGDHNGGERHDPIAAALQILNERPGNRKRTRKEIVEYARAVAYHLVYQQVRVGLDGYELDGYKNEDLSEHSHRLRALGTIALAVVFGRQTRRVEGQTMTRQEYSDSKKAKLKKVREGYHTNLNAPTYGEVYGVPTDPDAPRDFLTRMTDLQYQLKQQEKKEEERKKKSKQEKKEDKRQKKDKPEKRNEFSWHRDMLMPGGKTGKDSYESKDKVNKELALGEFDGLNPKLEDHLSVHEFLQSLDLAHNYRLTAALWQTLFNGNYAQLGGGFGDIDAAAIQETAGGLSEAMEVAEYKKGLQKTADMLERAMKKPNVPSIKDKTPEGVAWRYFLAEHGGNVDDARDGMLFVIEQIRGKVPEVIDEKVDDAKKKWAREREQLTDLFNEGQNLNPNIRPPQRYTFRKVKGQKLLDGGHTHEIGMTRGNEVKTFDIRGRKGLAEDDFVEVSVHVLDEESSTWSGPRVVGYIDARTGAPVGNKPIAAIETVRDARQAEVRDAQVTSVEDQGLVP
jgi:hypothetical protein